MPRFTLSISQIAAAVWGTVVPVASRTTTCSTMSDKTGYSGAVTDKTGYSGAVTDKTGYTISSNTDKAGYSLTAGSYVIRASSSQQSDVTLTATTETGKDASITFVTTTRAISSFGDASHSNNGTDNTFLPNGRITAANTYRVERNTATGDTVVAFEIAEFF